MVEPLNLKNSADESDKAEENQRKHEALLWVVMEQLIARLDLPPQDTIS